MAIENVRLSEKAKTQLTKIKAKTGIGQWNVLCRWAFCLSLKEKTIPPHEDIITDSNVEMTWKTFGGSDQDLYYALLRQRLVNDGISLSSENVLFYFKLHLHRGISYLSQKVNSIENLFDL
ncbi:DNA sulfur modification protein DndE [Teredinibacter turnerae]|uniref:DNA sulfur modification protein DndE n=1 Tax=Teredinibacter turnerae TaxID=2426 RepID=UPI000408C211|nr:DNA sulfur modification protein DndE [Teredinibacter turnerae]